jgi:hypothetical protein
MANLFTLPVEKFNAFTGMLAEAGLTAEQAEAISTNRSLAAIMVAALVAAGQKAVQMFTAFVKYLQPSFDELREAFDWVNPDFAKVQFDPIERCKNIVRVAGEVAFRYFAIDHQMTTEEILDAMDAAGLRPALYEELLAFASKYPNEQRKYLIAALGSVARFGGALRVACLSGNDRVRRLDLRYGRPVSPWSDDWFFLAVSK